MFKKDFAATYTERNNKIKNHNFPKELIDKIDWATNFRNNPDFDSIKDENAALDEAKNWVEFAFKYIIKRHLKLKNDDWKTIADAVYNKLPYIYHEPYIPHKMFFPAQYYLNIKYFQNALRKGETLPKALLNWRDAGLRVAIPLFLYLYDEKDLAKHYLEKITNNTEPLKQRILDIYGYYYLQRLI
jgi:hypothetical protein